MRTGRGRHITMPPESESPKACRTCQRCMGHDVTTQANQAVCGSNQAGVAKERWTAVLYCAAMRPPCAATGHLQAIGGSHSGRHWRQ
jgi:hypothetical protein